MFDWLDMTGLVFLSYPVTAGMFIGIKTGDG